MILVAGLPDEGPIACLLHALDAAGLSCLMLDQRAHEEIHVDLAIDPVSGLLKGELILPGGTSTDVGELTAIYARLHGADSLPELARLPLEAASRVRFDRLTALLTQLCDLAPARVVNRSLGMVTNASKPLQAQIIQQAGFAIPRTLVTNSPDRARSFLGSAPEGAIFKSASSIRSIVREIRPGDLDRLDALRLCPVQFQDRIPGTDIRVHVVGDEVFATRIETGASDYRYAAQQKGEEVRLSVTDLPAQIAARCLRLAQRLDLVFAGIDLRVTPDSEWVCFEVNPSPGYSYYEDQTGQPIAAALARYLIGEAA